MAQIRIHTEQVREVGRQFRAKSEQLNDIDNALQSTIGNLDTWAWDGRSRADAEPMLDQVRPESDRIAQELDRLGQILQHVASSFENEDNTVAKEIEGAFIEDIFDNTSTTAPQEIPSLFGQGNWPALTNAIVNSLTFLAPGFAAVATEWLPDITKYSTNLGFFGREHKLWPERRGRPRKNEADRKLRVAVFEGEVWGDKKTGSTKLGGVRLGGKSEIKALHGEAGLGVNFKDGHAMAGVYAGGTLFTAGASGVIGDTNLGLGAGVDLNAGEAEAFVGLKDGRAGAKIGGSLVSAEGTVGANVAGWNVGLTGEIGVKFEVGLEVGKKTRVYLGPFTIGLNIGEALGS